jgi:hypothetical protein
MATSQSAPSLPSLGDWCNAVIHGDNYQDDSLKAAKIQLNAQGLPRARSGAFAVVFRATLPNGQDCAVRVFTAAQPERQERYKLIHDHLSSQSLKFLVPFTYSEKGIRCKGKRYPLVTMDWVKGDTLFDWLQQRANANDGRAIGIISDKWRDVIGGLKRAQIAHGDLQDRNVMITDTSEIKLVDYDGMCVPKLIGRKNEELGVPPYQHPQRCPDTQLSLSLDNFSSIFIYVGLKALSVDPRLWQEFVVQPDYDKILFRKEDFEDPAHSSLFGRLRSSPDNEVKRLVKELGDLWRLRMDQVPALDDLLFSFDQVSVLLDQRDFDAAKELLARNKKQPTDAPPAMQPRIQDALQRVAKREELEKAVASCNEVAMAALAGIPLLQGYPRAAEPLAMATDAAAVVQAIQKLDAAKTGSRWRELVQVWDASRSVLTRPKGTLRGSVKGYESDVQSWRERNSLCDQLLGSLKAADPDVAAVAAAWKQLADRGGHPEADQHRAAIDLATARDAAWQKFQAGPARTDEASDTAAVAAWNESVFRGWPRAEAQRPRIEECRRRLQAAAAVRVVAGSLSKSGEEEVIRLGAALPPGWSQEIAKRSEMAQQRLAALTAFTAAITADSDIQIAGAHRGLHGLQATALISSADRSRVDVALKREPAVAALQKIPSAYKNTDATRWDGKLIAAWNESLLGDCSDAAAWKPTVETAVRRQKLLRLLEKEVAARDKGDAFAGGKIAAEPCLQGYSFDEPTIRWLAWARSVTDAVRGMTDAAAHGDRAAFLESFDSAFMRDHASMLEPHWPQLVEWVKSDVVPAATPQTPIGQKALEVSPGATKGASRCRLKWRWPDRRFTDECHVAVCRSKPSASAKPESLAAWLSFPMTRELYESAGGSRSLQAEAEWKGGYVVVWARIDLGPEIFWSQPLVLGRI